MPPFAHPSRRALLGAALASPAVSAVVGRENAREGARDWQLTNVLIDRKEGFRSSRIEGYCSHQSIRAGETLRVMASARPAGRATLTVFRMGYYGGRGARQMGAFGPFAVRPQPDPPVGERRLRECRWEPSVEIKIPTDWPSGVYLGRLERVAESRQEHAWQSYVIFIVRDDRRADVLFQCSDNTWQAYNRWPDDFSLYTDPRHVWAPDVAVSFDRPYGKYAQIYDHPLSIGSGEFLLWEYPLCYWLEQHGYDVTYSANADLLDPAEARRGRVFLSVGHDEYWDRRQYDHALAAVQSGVSYLFLTGNAVCGLSPFEPAGAGGAANRVLSRRGRFGGASAIEKREFYKYEFPESAPNEALLMGARSPYPFNGGGDWIVERPGHWMFAGTGMRAGDRIPGLVGWEFHGDPAPLPGLEVVARGTALSGGVKPVDWVSTIYPGPKGNFVFNASTIWWAQGLASPPGHMLPWSHGVRPHGPDARVERITANLLRRALRGA